MERALRDKKAICFFVLPALIWFCAIALFPVFQSAGYSLMDWDGVTEANFIGLENYKEMFQDPLFFKAIWNSLLLAIASIFIQLPISMILALILAGGVKGENFYRNAFFVPVIISGTIIAHLWLKVYHPSYGLLNMGLGALGLESLQREWLGDGKTALVACFIPMVWQYIGYHMLLFYSAAKSISPEIIEAAHVDGANRFQTAIRVIIPMIVPMIKACVIFAIIGSLKSFDLIYILTNGGPVHASEVPSLLMYKKIFITNEYGYASAIAIFIILECLLFTFVVQKIFNHIQKD
ncbi:MAG: sugar ABC transporter permease [Oliverpabstia sp.]|nr:sugar ABC transporter permease [Oliverpabstia sp.]